MSPEPSDPLRRALPGLSEDWPRHATERIVRAVNRVRAATDRPSANLARRLVYGMIMAVLAILMFVLGVIGMVRLVDVYLPGDMWATHTLLGGFFAGVGLLLWSKRPRRAAG